MASLRALWKGERVLKISEAYARYPNIAPYVEKALPAHDDTPMTARQIFERARFGSLNSTRLILNIFEAEGLVVSRDGPPHGDRSIPAKVWRLALGKPPHGISEQAARFIVEVVG